MMRCRLINSLFKQRTISINKIKSKDFRRKSRHRRIWLTFINSNTFPESRKKTTSISFCRKTNFYLTRNLYKSLSCCLKIKSKNEKPPFFIDKTLNKDIKFNFDEKKRSDNWRNVTNNEKYELFYVRNNTIVH